MIGSGCNLKCKTVQTDAIHNGKFFNAGFRKQTDSFRLPHFIENIIQALLYSIDLKDGWVLIGGDGRIYSNDLAMKAINVLAGNGVRKVVIGLNGWLPSSAAACLMGHQHCHFGLHFTGGHQPPGDNGYLGLKILSPPGIPIREEVTAKANRILRSLQSYSTCEKLTLDFDQIGETKNVVSGRRFSIEVVDPVTPYLEAMKEMFDLPFIREYVRNFKMLISCSGGVTGTFVKRIFVEELGIPERRILNATPMEDFGGWSPDPNPVTYKKFLSRLQEGEYQFGAVVNPDGCRCMVVGEEGFAVSPSDSLAIVAAHSQCMPCFQECKLETVVRTICTSQAVDRVANELSFLHFETPVGWQNFSGAMLPARGKAGLFGEECSALGISTDRFCGDKDGILTILCWLSILAATKKSVKEVVEDHWNTYGRSFFGRLDFRNVPQQFLDSFLNFFTEKNSLRFEKIKSGNFSATVYLDPFGVDPNLQTEEAKRRNTEIVFDIENYVYPYGFIKKSLLKDDHYQIYQIRLMEDSRLVIRRSESTSSSSTLRFYIEYMVEPGNERLLCKREIVLQPFIEAAMKVTKIKEFISPDMNPVFV